MPEPIKKILVISLFLILHHPALCRPWEKKAFAQKAFLENRGQFRLSGCPDSILYGFTSGGTGIYFTASGVYWHLQRAIPGKPEPGQEPEKCPVRISSSLVAQKWLHANPSSPVAEVRRADYSTFRNLRGQRVYGYEKLCYRNIYDNIDLEFSFHPEDGIKYCFILHPGAAAGDIEMEYSGQENIELRGGNVFLSTSNGMLMDHAPLSFFEKDSTPLPSWFELNGNRIRFGLGNYDPASTVIIDPWIITPTALTVDLKAFEVDFDKYGNVYVAGGHGNYKIQKYTPAGTLLWTYDSGFGSLSSYTSTFGDLAVSREGFSYMTEGFGDHGRCKVDPAGNEVWFYDKSSNTTTFSELFHLAFNRDFTKLYLGGRAGKSANLAFIDTSNGRISGIRTVNARHEVRSMCVGADGNIYALTCSDLGALDGNFLVAASPTLTPASFTSIPSGYNWSEEGVAYGNGNTVFGPGWTGQNGIAANNCHIYTYSGLTADKRNPGTGAVLSSITVPSAVPGQNSGIAVDSCGFVYIGSQAMVLKYDPTLTVVLDTGFTTGAVYDVAIGVNGTVLAAGNGFVASFDMNACHFLPLNCTTPAVSLELLSFTARNEGPRNVISWTLANAREGSCYVLEKSAEGSLFEPLYKTSLASDQKSGSFSDLHPFPVTYYRLKEVNSRGGSEFSGMISVRNSGFSPLVRVAPNPVRKGSTLVLSFSGEVAPLLHVRLYDLSTRKLLETSLHGISPFTETVLDLPPLSSGTYILELSSDSYSEKKKILIGEQ